MGCVPFLSTALVEGKKLLFVFFFRKFVYFAVLGYFRFVILDNTSSPLFLICVIFTHNVVLPLILFFFACRKRKENMNKTTKRGGAAAYVPAAKKTNDFHKIRISELRREQESLKGAPPAQLPPSYFTPSLKEICARVIADNFEFLPNADALRDLQEDKDLYKLVIDQLRTDLKLSVSVPRVPVEDYWRACCEARWSIGQLTSFLKSGRLVPPERGGWKRVYLERNLEERLMSFDGGKVMSEEEEHEIVQLCVLCGGHIYSIRLTHQQSHFDFREVVFSKLAHLEEFSLTYSVANVGVAFKLDMIGFTQNDALCLQRVLREYTALKSLSLPSNRMTCTLLKAVLVGLVRNNTLQKLDLSHNQIGDEGARTLGTVLMKKDIALVYLDLTDNEIGSDGAVELAGALRVNMTIHSCYLKLNRIGDDGGCEIFDALSTNASITHFSIANNRLGAKCTRHIAQSLEANSTITSLDVSGNDFGEEGINVLATAVERCSSLLEIDARNCNMDSEGLERMKRTTQKRVQVMATQELEREDEAVRNEIQRLVSEKLRKSHGIVS